MSVSPCRHDEVGSYRHGRQAEPRTPNVRLEEAEKQTSIVARADYALKKLLWLP